MHGLNVNQVTGYDPVFQQNQDSGQNQFAYTRYFSVDQPDQLPAAIPNYDVIDGNTQVYIKRLYRTMYFTNSAMVPIRVQLLWVRARLDVPLTMDIFSIMNEGGVRPDIPYASMTTGEDFKKYFRVIKSKHTVWKPGVNYRVKAGSVYAGGRPITKDVEGDLTHFRYRKKNTIVVVKAYGIPEYYRAANQPSVQSTALSSVILRIAFHTYCSFYRMDDATPNTAITNFFPLALTQDNLQGNPTYANFIQENTAPLSNNYSGPNTVVTISG